LNIINMHNIYQSISRATRIVHNIILCEYFWNKYRFQSRLVHTLRSMCMNTLTVQEDQKTQVTFGGAIP
jgi:hypothetical protein